MKMKLTQMITAAALIAVIPLHASATKTDGAKGECPHRAGGSFNKPLPRQNSQHFATVFGSKGSSGTEGTPSARPAKANR